MRRAGTRGGAQGRSSVQQVTTATGVGGLAHLLATVLATRGVPRFARPFGESDALSRSPLNVPASCLIGHADTRRLAAPKPRPPSLSASSVLRELCPPQPLSSSTSILRDFSSLRPLRLSTPTTSSEVSTTVLSPPLSAFHCHLPSDVTSTKCWAPSSRSSNRFASPPILRNTLQSRCPSLISPYSKIVCHSVAITTNITACQHPWCSAWRRRPHLLSHPSAPIRSTFPNCNIALAVVSTTPASFRRQSPQV